MIKIMAGKELFSFGDSLINWQRIMGMNMNKEKRSAMFINSSSYAFIDMKDR